MIQNFFLAIVAIIIVAIGVNQLVLAQIPSPQSDVGDALDFLGDTIPVTSWNFIPRNTTYRSVEYPTRVEMRIKTHTNQQVIAMFVLRDSSGAITGKWNATLNNEDSPESETELEDDGITSIDVSVYRSKRPYYVTLRIPFDDPGKIWMTTGHPKIPRDDGYFQKLILVLDKE